ncbi:MAG: carbohydrate binding family 9 domain-containing protein [Acidobacteria bacterium]|nr:carbohydrate binding family 9 domain-containing protein [Acidobacteriota bacterium]
MSAVQTVEGVDFEAVRATKRVTAVRIFDPIKVDGLLDEPAWQRAAPADHFYQKEPQEGSPAKYQTEVRFLYDVTTLYVGAILYDDDPQRAITNELKRDFSGLNSDSIALIIDTFLDRRNAYGFLTNQGGAQRDTLAYDQGRRNDPSWHGVWSVGTAVHPESWTVEYAIPFKTLRFPNRLQQAWGLNILRVMRRFNELSTWSPVPRQFSHYHVGYAGLLLGIEGVQPGRNLQVKPFFTAQSTNSDAGWKADSDGGVDLKWAVTPSLVLDGTYRTDFSQIEADEQQINLTRFSLFFPEKREFFLESPTSFQVGLAEGDSDAQRRDLVPFFSRRIGLSDRGEPIPVVVGVRLTGRLGSTGIGLLNMQTESTARAPGDNFTAVRITRGLGGGMTLGASYFGREAVGRALGSVARHNRVASLDVRFSPRRTIEMEGLVFGAFTDGAKADLAARAGLRLQTAVHRARVGYLHIGENFRHDLGFVRRQGIGTIFMDYSRTFRPKATYRWIRGYSIGPSFDLTSNDRYDQWLTHNSGLTYSMDFADGGDLQISATSTFERLLAPFPIRTGIVIPTEEYTTAEGLVKYTSDMSKSISGSMEFRKGGFWSGTRMSPRGNIRVRLNAHLAASASYSRDRVELREGSFIDSLASFRLDWSLTTKMFLNAFIQYNGTTRTWFSNVRFNLIHRPLSDIYIVWNETRSPFTKQHGLIVKYTHMIAF